MAAACDSVILGWWSTEPSDAEGGLAKTGSTARLPYRNHDDDFLRVKHTLFYDLDVLFLYDPRSMALRIPSRTSTKPNAP
jgi:hypothetical protein